MLWGSLDVEFLCAFPAGLALILPQDLADADLALLLDVREADVTLHHGTIMSHALLQDFAPILNTNAIKKQIQNHTAYLQHVTLCILFTKIEANWS